MVTGLALSLLAVGCRGKDTLSPVLPLERRARANAIESAKRDLQCRKVEAKVVGWMTLPKGEKFDVAVGGCGLEVRYEARCKRPSCALQMTGAVSPAGEHFPELDASGTSTEAPK